MREREAPGQPRRLPLPGTTGTSWGEGRSPLGSGPERTRSRAWSKSPGRGVLSHSPGPWCLRGVTSRTLCGAWNLRTPESLPQ